MVMANHTIQHPRLVTNSIKSVCNLIKTMMPSSSSLVNLKSLLFLLQMEPTYLFFLYQQFITQCADAVRGYIIHVVLPSKEGV